MLTVLVTLLIVALALVLLLWVGTLWAQGYFYDSPTPGLAWRAPAAAGALVLFLLLWTLIEFRRPNTTDTIFRFSTAQATDFDRFVSVRLSEEGKEEEIPFEKHGLGSGRFEFRDQNGKVWSRSSSGMMVAIILEEKEPGGSEKVRHRFNAQRDKDGKFAPKGSPGMQQSLRYTEEGGDRFIVEDELGKAFSFRRSRLLLNIVINGLHFVVWFLVLWLLLHFQWPHALGFALVCWAVLTLALLPYLFGRARDAAMVHDKPKAVAMHLVPPAWGRMESSRLA
jgi:hypothetical protein